jgi:hypothetical protein
VSTKLDLTCDSWYLCKGWQNIQYFHAMYSLMCIVCMETCRWAHTPFLHCVRLAWLCYDVPVDIFYCIVFCDLSNLSL